MTVVLCPATASVLKNNTGPTELRVRYLDIYPDEAPQLEQALSVNTTLTVLELNESFVDSEGAEHLGKLSGGQCLKL